MTPTSTLPPTAVGVGRKSKLKILGFLTWFAVPDQPVKFNKLRKEWVIAGLDPKLLPPEPRPLFLFQRAMRAQEGKRRGDDGTEVVTDVREVLNEDTCIYQISRVVRDADQKVVDYPKAMRVIFNKVGEEITYDPLGEVPRSELLPLMEAIQDKFEQADLVDGRKVRGIVRDYIRDDSDERSNRLGLSGENLRGKGGGVYFVPAKHEAELESLESCLDALYPDGRAFLHSLPVADGEGEREMIRRHHLENAKREADEAISDVRDLLREDRKNAVRSDIAAHHWARARAMDRRLAEYSSILGEESEEIAARREVLQKQLAKLPGA